ncbi:MAG: peptide chain release factor N(5)-glutamine methyltransferase [Alphaproteobacteria bacterium]|nr:peptide chain release factor N(5)-glutamine methyltransferase [Alphaproteobacteria bacterium]
MMVREELQRASHLLKNAGIDTAALDARLLLQYLLGVSREALALQPDRLLTSAQAAQFEALMARRIAREPISQILGKREFWGLEFAVTQDTLTPRPDTETLITALLAHQPNRSTPLNILDLGTGTGCLLLSALSEYPLSSGLGVDLSEAALAVARRNAEALGLKNRAIFKKSDWNSQINGVWDVVLGNPPYIPTEEIPQLLPEVADYEPVLALDGGDDGLHCYRTITRFLPRILAGEGVALLEVGAGQAGDVVEMAITQGLKIAQVAKDLAGIERCVVIKK